MPRRPDNMETVRLAIELLKLIPRSHRVTAQELHAKLKDKGFDRDVRTIQRQLEVLSEHYEIERDDRSKPYGYRWKENASSLSLAAMTTKEALLLTLAEQQLQSLLPSRVAKSMESYFTQARRSLGSDKHAELEREWLGKVRIVSTTQPLLPPAIKNGILEAVSEALYSNRWLRVDYRNAAGKRSTSDVMPLGLAQQGPAMYLVCRYRGYESKRHQAERHQALHRMNSALVLPEQFERPVDFNLERYDGEGHFGLGAGRRILLEFDITKGAGLHLEEMKLSNDQVMTERRGGYRVAATLMDTEWLRRWLRAFGEDVSRVRIQELDSHRN